MRKKQDYRKGQHHRSHAENKKGLKQSKEIIFEKQ
jgi:hypothetical protein